MPLRLLAVGVREWSCLFRSSEEQVLRWDYDEEMLWGNACEGQRGEGQAEVGRAMHRDAGLCL